MIHVLDATAFHSHCEITICEAAFMVMVLVGTNGILRGKLYVMATRTICPGSFVPVLQAGGIEPMGPHQLAVTVMALAVVSIPGNPRPLT
jgi:hypothetical protein